MAGWAGVKYFSPFKALEAEEKKKRFPPSFIRCSGALKDEKYPLTEKSMSFIFEKIRDALVLLINCILRFFISPLGLLLTALCILTVMSGSILTSELDEYVKYDDREVSLSANLEKELTLFSAEYKSESGDVKISGLDGEKTLAPGASSSYPLRLRNTGGIALDCRFTSSVEFSSEKKIPIEVRLTAPDGEYLWGSETEWENISDVGTITVENPMPVNATEEYIFEWRWDYEGDDAYDTLLGNAAVNEELGVEITVGIAATANTDFFLNGGLFNSALGEIIIVGAITVILGLCAAILVIPAIRAYINKDD